MYLCPRRVDNRSINALEWGLHGYLHIHLHGAASSARSAAQVQARCRLPSLGTPPQTAWPSPGAQPPTHLSTLAPYLPTHTPTPQNPNTHLQLAVTEVATMRSRTSGSVVNLSRRKPS